VVVDEHLLDVLGVQDGGEALSGQPVGHHVAVDRGVLQELDGPAHQVERVPEEGQTVRPGRERQVRRVGVGRSLGVRIQVGGVPADRLAISRVLRRRRGCVRHTRT